MGSNAGKAIASVPGASFDSSAASGSNIFNKIGQGTSSSASSSNFSGSLEEPNQYGKCLEKYELLEDTINFISIGIEPLGLDFGHTVLYHTGPVRCVLPSHLGGGKFFYHLSCLLELKKNRESIILEYGAYHGREPTYKNYIHYVYGEEKGGLRFSKMSVDDYHNKINNGKKGACIMGDLFIENKLTLQELLIECKLTQSWTANDYNLATHNCQDFIAKVIEVLKVERTGNDRTKYSHASGKLFYPPVILNALEKNDMPTALKIAESIPIVNSFVEIGARIYKSSNK